MNMGVLYITIILLLLAVIVLLIVCGMKARIPKKKLSDFEKKIVEYSNSLMSNQLGASDLRGIACLESAIERDEQSETLFVNSIKTSNKIHITKYIWHYGIMLYTISDYKSRIKRAKLDESVARRIIKAVDNYTDALCEILRFCFKQPEAKKCASVILQLLDNFAYEEKMIVSLDNDSARVVKSSISIAKKIVEEKYDEITDREITYGAMWFGRANFIEAYGMNRLCEAAEKSQMQILVSYSIVEDEVELLVATDDMRYYAYKRFNYVSCSDLSKLSTQCDDFSKFVRKNAKSQIVKNSI